MSDKKVVSITEAARTQSELSLRETMIHSGVHNYILETCGNSASLGHGTKLDHMAVKLEIQLFTGLLEACAENPNFDSEIFFDSFVDDLQALYKKLHGEYRNYQEIKTKLKIEESSTK